MADRLRNESEAAFVLKQAVRCSPARLAKRHHGRSRWVTHALTAARNVGAFLLFVGIIVGWMYVIPLFFYLLGGR